MCLLVARKSFACILEHSLNDQLSLFCFSLYQKGGNPNRRIEQITERESVNQMNERNPSRFQLVSNFSDFS